MRGDSFTAAEPAGVRWLHVHPDYAVPEACWTIVRLARGWRDGIMPEAGGTLDQAARTAAMIEIVLTAWGKLEAALVAKNRKS